MNPLYDLVIVGAASAGLTAGIYASRQGLRTLIIGKDVGGQALLTNSIQNYPGILDISGFDLASKFEEHAKTFGSDIVYDEVSEINPREGVCFTVKTSTTSYDTCALILAFGKTPRDLGVPGEDKLKGRGVSYCAVCDGPLFKGKTVGVVGNADPAIDATELLSGLASKVYFVHNWDKPVGDEQTLERLKQKSSVQFVTNSRVLEIKGDATVGGLLLENTATKEKSDLPVNGVFVELGYVAKTDFVKDLVQLNAKKEIIVDKECQTSHPGVFAAGDVTDITYKQAVVSAAQGAIAALSAYNYIQRLRGGSTIRADWKVKEVAKKS